MKPAHDALIILLFLGKNMENMGSCKEQKIFRNKRSPEIVACCGQRGPSGNQWMQMQVDFRLPMAAWALFTLARLDGGPSRDPWPGSKKTPHGMKHVWNLSVSTSPWGYWPCTWRNSCLLQRWPASNIIKPLSKFREHVSSDLAARTPQASLARGWSACVMTSFPHSRSGQGIAFKLQTSS